MAMNAAQQVAVAAAQLAAQQDQARAFQEAMARAAFNPFANAMQSMMGMMGFNQPSNLMMPAASSNMLGSMPPFSTAGFPQGNLMASAASNLPTYSPGFANPNMMTSAASGIPTFVPTSSSAFVQSQPNQLLLGTSPGLYASVNPPPSNQSGTHPQPPGPAN